MNLRNSQAVESRDIEEYLAHIVKRNIRREAILKAMADHGIEALAYPTIRRKANVIGETQTGSNCQLSANSGLPGIVVPSVRPISRRMTRTGDARSSNEGAARSRNEAKPSINMPAQRRASPTPKPKERPASKGRVHMGKTRV